VKQGIILTLLTIFATGIAQEFSGYQKEIQTQDSLIKHFLEISPKQALLHAHTAYKQSILRTDSTNIAYFSMYLGVIHKRLSAYDSALHYYHKALEIQKKIKHTAGVAGSYNNIAFVYKLLGKYELSVDYYLKALSENEKSNNIKSQTTILNNIGNVFADQNQFSEALRYYGMSAELAKKHNLEENYAQVCNNEGEIYFKQKKLDLAEQKFKEAYIIKKKYSKPRMLGSAFGNLAKVFYAKEQFDSSLFYARKSLEAYNIAKDANGSNAAKVHITLCLSHLNTEKQEIEKQYWEIIKNAYQNQDKNNLIIACKDLSDHYAKQKKMDSAYFYLLHHVVHKDSSHNMHITQKINELLTKYETTQKQRRIDSLTHQNNLSQYQKKQTQLKANIALIGFVSFLALTIVFMYLYYIKNRHNQEIREKNTIIEQSLHHRELLIKEVHHRVKNNLQIISSLLNLQVHLAKDNVEELVKNSQDRIYAMSIIHEKLYQSENLEAIDFKEYIEKLMTYFQQSYELDKRHISLQTNITPLFLDIDTLIPCGLIINELITNSIKYAFEPQQKGVIQIWTELKEKQCTLYIKDDGKGLPKDFNPNQGKSLGSRLIKGFAQQLKAQLEYHSDNGTMVSLTFSV
jgi:two-component sensor histidine kinase/Tfp pilus assembly protein PilF